MASLEAWQQALLHPTTLPAVLLWIAPRTQQVEGPVGSSQRAVKKMGRRGKASCCLPVDILRTLLEMRYVFCRIVWRVFAEVDRKQDSYLLYAKWQTTTGGLAEYNYPTILLVCIQFILPIDSQKILKVGRYRNMWQTTLLWNVLPSVVLLLWW